MKDFRVLQIDHVELFVPDQYQAGAWYEQVLGLEIVPEHEHWATNEGPLMLSSDGSRTMLALFAGEPRGSRQTAGHHRVAFRVTASGFLRFLERLVHYPVFNDSGHRVTKADIVDHSKAFSIYFNDPYGNRYEITTYDTNYVARQFAR